jgi:hypothetical protein
MIASESPRGLRGGYVPEEDGAVAAHGRERGVVGGDGDVEDFVAVCGVGLDQLRGFWGSEGGGGGWWGCWGA